MTPNYHRWRVEATDPDRPEPFNVVIRVCKDKDHAEREAEGLRQQGWEHVTIVAPDPLPAKPIRPLTYRGFKKW